jgi:hypothetical protein
MARVAHKISDGRILSLIESFLRQDIMKEMEHWRPTAGTPQGAVMSPLLANIYLDPLDLLMEESGYRMVRYADDFVILCRTRQEAEAALDRVAAWVARNGPHVASGQDADRRLSRTGAGSSSSWATGSRPGFDWCARKACARSRTKSAP